MLHRATRLDEYGTCWHASRFASSVFGSRFRPVGALFLLPPETVAEKDKLGKLGNDDL